eukprot:gene3227-1546_t
MTKRDLCEGEKLQGNNGNSWKRKLPDPIGGQRLTRRRIVAPNRSGMSLLTKLAFLVGIIAICISISGFYKIINEIHSSLNYEDRVVGSISKDTLRLFNNYDQDGDRYLDIFEFDAVKKFILASQEHEKHITEEEVDTKLKKEKLINAKLPQDVEYITLRAKFKPLLLETMSKSKHDLQGIDPMGDVHLKGLKSWQKPFIQELNFTCKDLNIFLPKGNVKVGEAWDVVLPISSRYEPGLSHNRFYPEKPTGEKERVLLNILTMFWPQPFVLNRFAPQGTMAVLRGITKDYYDIVFRVHAEFQMNEPPNFPFWFTPAQFTGNIIISKDGEHIEHFHIFVPNDKKLNVDMEWITGKKKVIDQASDPWEMEVDIGYLPEMSLENEFPSRRIGENRKQKEQFAWDNEISPYEAKRILQKKFYPFQEIEYLPFNKTYQRAQNEDKLVHHILLWGSGRTLREGPLESSPILKLLKKHFISSWSLIAELKDLSANSTDADVRKLADIGLEGYKFPVQSMVQYPNGTILSSLNANELLDASQTLNSISSVFDDPVSSNYYNFLQQGLKKAGREL